MAEEKILIIANGDFGKDFIKELCQNYQSFMIIITPKDLWFKASNASFYDFDPTSALKLDALCKDKAFTRAFIVLDKKDEAYYVYEHLRGLFQELFIILCDFWQLDIKDALCEQISPIQATSKRLLGFLPKTPRYAQFIGAGLGEIMEVKLGFGSPFAYRHVSSISQRRYKIALIYRGDKIILAKPDVILLPNDDLLLVGNPTTLKSIHSQLCTVNARFPRPFGTAIFALIDMQEEKANKQILCALALQKKLRSDHLYIHVINAKLDKHYEKIKENENDEISVYFDFLNHTPSFDLKCEEIGLVVASTKAFNKHKNKLFEFNLPVLKMGEIDFNKLSFSCMLSSDCDEIEGLAAPAFDIIKQLSLPLRLYFYSKESDNEYKQYFQHLKNLAKLHGEKIEIRDFHSQNPLSKLVHKNDFLQILSFDKKILKPWYQKIISTDFNKLYYKTSHAYQLFIPRIY